ncbi:short chain dehydrogenase [Rhizobium tibeticum]|uniref:3-ketoacyl-(Acyl-carrier-protein) reductase n=1 Tax=Rhizobium tibeticum TaxID=501024 RepID=A0A1H8W063_9HYPH|nr:SDR family NAD(P)-dependent oxidoreductase [Rhizobium tibeticum]SEI20079.1 3-ketoacyl-(acyl-carrier-protein) reductase [Rhizobium tibeticum]SEP21031.1 short chain dehydrogenase [Rhizobium tibeticum]
MRGFCSGGARGRATLSHRRTREPGESGPFTVAATLSNVDVEARPFAAVLTDVAACDALIGKVAAWARRLDALISNAGQSRPGKLAEMSPEDWQQTLDLNLRATPGSWRGPHTGH